MGSPAAPAQVSRPACVTCAVSDRRSAKILDERRGYPLRPVAPARTRPLAGLVAEENDKYVRRKPTTVRPMRTRQIRSSPAPEATSVVRTLHGCVGSRRGCPIRRKDVLGLSFRTFRREAGRRCPVSVGVSDSQPMYRQQGVSQSCWRAPAVLCDHGHVGRVKMQAGEIETDSRLVRRLLRHQFPHWADLPIQMVPSYGTDHDIYRLGDQLCARMPRTGWAAGQAERESVWLPRLAPHLPLAPPTRSWTPSPAPCCSTTPNAPTCSIWSAPPLPPRPRRRPLTARPGSRCAQSCGTCWRR